MFGTGYRPVATKRINHFVAFVDEDCYTNQAESYFSRLRRMEIGTHHHIGGRYLRSYAHLILPRPLL